MDGLEVRPGGCERKGRACTCCVCVCIPPSPFLPLSCSGGGGGGGDGGLPKSGASSTCGLSR
eukprot:3984603-Prymnesium_polylepis.3